MDDEDFSKAYCDQCGPNVRAKRLAVFQDGSYLAWCNHCTNLHREAVEQRGGEIWDLRNE